VKFDKIEALKPDRLAFSTRVDLGAELYGRGLRDDVQPAASPKSSR
jgi:hypothetical protein